MENVLNAFVLLANYVLVPALTYGSQLALGALGATLIYAVLRFSNFAHGDLMALGTMGVILTTWWLQSLGVSLGALPTALLALPAGILVAVVLCLLTDRWVYAFYRKRRSPPVVFVIASVGVMFVYNALTRFVIGTDEQRFEDGARFVMRAPDFKAWSGLNEGLAIRTSQLITVIVMLITVTFVFWFLQKTRTGKAMRAYSDNEDLALLSGISPERVVMITWILAAALATIAGTLYGLDKSFRPFTYFQLLLPIFAAAIVGGIGQPFGAIVGGFLIAFSEVMVTYAYKGFLTYLLPASWQPSGLVQMLGTDYKFAVSFIILVVVLLVRPTGILRGREI
ncbi:MAG: branched-chain amino acid ABC transporter permease [Amaricoccus sp.]